MLDSLEAAADRGDDVVAAAPRQRSSARPTASPPRTRRASSGGALVHVPGRRRRSSCRCTSRSRSPRRARAPRSASLVVVEAALEGHDRRGARGRRGRLPERRRRDRASATAREVDYVRTQDLHHETVPLHDRARRDRPRRGAALDGASTSAARLGKARMESRLVGPRLERARDRPVRARRATSTSTSTRRRSTRRRTRPRDLAFKGVLQGRSALGLARDHPVDKGAQKTDAFQENRNLLLSPHAHADSIPGLEILANDVRCTHAATIGQVDRELLFFLMARGFDAHRGRAADRARRSSPTRSSASRTRRCASASRPR